MVEYFSLLLRLGGMSCMLKIGNCAEWKSAEKPREGKCPDAEPPSTASRCCWPVSCVRHHLFGQVGVNIFWFTHLAAAAVSHCSSAERRKRVWKATWRLRRRMYVLLRVVRNAMSLHGILPANQLKNTDISLLNRTTAVVCGIFLVLSCFLDVI